MADSAIRPIRMDDSYSTVNVGGIDLDKIVKTRRIRFDNKEACRRRLDLTGRYL